MVLLTLSSVACRLEILRIWLANLVHLMHVACDCDVDCLWGCVKTCLGLGSLSYVHLISVVSQLKAFCI